MLFSGKENVFMCLAVTKFVLRKINFGVWFIQTFLQKMHQIRQKKQNAAKENESNPAEEKMRSRGEGDIERRWGRCDRPTSGARSTSALVNRDRRSRSSITPLDERDRTMRSHRSRSSIAPLDRQSQSSIAPLVGRAARSGLWTSGAIWALSSLSLSLSLFPEMIWSENEGEKSFPGQRWKYWSTRSHFPENIIFRDSQTCEFGGKWFTESFSPGNHFPPKQTHP